jgi:C-terminal processing protease CtpA/Prc
MAQEDQSSKFLVPFEEYARLKLWRTDPNLSGKGIGLVIAEGRDGWRVRRVLKKSPAERAGVEPQSLLHAINDYELRDGDVAELQMIVRFGVSEECVVALETRGSKTQALIRPTWLRRIIGIDIGLDDGDGGGGGYCNTCKRCYSTTNGFVTCGQGGCSGRCAVV